MVGFINVYKPEGMSSAFAVGKIKKIFNSPCGHMGTLDPMASGVLPVGIGKASRLFPYFLGKNKKYVAEFTFGYLTDTLDKTGKTVKDGGRIPEKCEIEKVLNKFVGKIEQMPPKYSAKCIDGKRGYQLARSGVEFTLTPKTVEVLSFTLNEKTGDASYKFTIECKGGTYIRSLCRDLGEELNTFATMTKLERVESGVFNLTNVVKLDALIDINACEKHVIAPDTVVNFEKIFLTPKQAEKIINGVFDNLGYKDGTYRVYGEKFLGIGTSNGGVLKINSYVR